MSFYENPSITEDQNRSGDVLASVTGIEFNNEWSLLLDSIKEGRDRAFFVFGDSQNNYLDFLTHDIDWHLLDDHNLVEYLIIEQHAAKSDRYHNRNYLPEKLQSIWIPKYDYKGMDYEPEGLNLVRVMLYSYQPITGKIKADIMAVPRV